MLLLSAFLLTDDLDLEDIILFENHVVVFRAVSDVFVYILGPSSGNEMLLSCALSGFVDALDALLGTRYVRLFDGGSM